MPSHQLPRQAGFESHLNSIKVVGKITILKLINQDNPGQFCEKLRVEIKLMLVQVTVGNNILEEVPFIHFFPGYILQPGGY